MKYQDEQYNCGPVALANALEAMDIERSVEELTKLCKTTTRGTSAANLARAAESVEGTDPWVFHSANPLVAALVIRQVLQGGRAAVLSVAGEAPGDHYAAAIGVCGDNVIVADPSGGVYSYNEKDLLEFWDSGSRSRHWMLVL